MLHPTSLSISLSLSHCRCNHKTGEWAHNNRRTKFPNRMWLSNFSILDPDSGSESEKENNKNDKNDKNKENDLPHDCTWIDSNSELNSELNLSLNSNLFESVKISPLTPTTAPTATLTPTSPSTLTPSPTPTATPTPTTAPTSHTLSKHTIITPTSVFATITVTDTYTDIDTTTIAPSAHTTTATHTITDTITDTHTTTLSPTLSLTTTDTDTDILAPAEARTVRTNNTVTPIPTLSARTLLQQWNVRTSQEIFQKMKILAHEELEKIEKKNNPNYAKNLNLNKNKNQIENITTFLTMEIDNRKEQEKAGEKEELEGTVKSSVNSELAAFEELRWYVTLSDPDNTYENAGQGQNMMTLKGKTLIFLYF